MIFDKVMLELYYVHNQSTFPAWAIFAISTFCPIKISNIGFNLQHENCILPLGGGNCRNGKQGGGGKQMIRRGMGSADCAIIGLNHFGVGATTIV
jgi:hypothetical protein